MSIFNLQKSIESVKSKLKAENIDLKDYDKAIECLSHCVASVYCIRIYKTIYCIRIYKEYINY